MRRLILSLLIFNIGYFLYTRDNTFKEKKEEKVSIIKYIPGLQQIKTKKYFKGGVFLSSFIAGIAGAVIYNSRGNDSYDNYLQSKDTDEIVELRKTTENFFKKRNLFIIGSGVVFLLHLFDLKFSNKKSGVKGEIKNNSIGVSLYYGF